MFTPREAVSPSEAVKPTPLLARRKLSGATFASGIIAAVAASSLTTGGSFPAKALSPSPPYFLMNE